MPQNVIPIGIQIFNVVTYTTLCILYLFIILTILIYFSKSIISGSIFKSKQFFYIFLLFFSLGRSTFFILELVLLIFLNSSKQKHLFEILSQLSIGIYHIASTCFYTSIFFSVIHWAESKITSGVMSENAANDSLKYPKIFIYFIIGLIHLVQLIFFCIRMTHKIQPRERVDIIDAIQLIYHFFLCWMNVFLCFIFIVYTIHLEWKGFKTNDSLHSKLFIVISVIQLFIIIKGLIYFTLAILEYLSYIQQTHPVASIINGVSLILLDLFPTLLIAFSMIHFGESKRSFSLMSIEKIY